ncbi:hypothetical protein L6R52_27820 [Myxococcota bacterium]|nr:hypothetical protein [Myxococcota bacterium]
MLARRQLPHRLIAATLAAASALALSACASDRYVGSLGRDLTYSNRGYGVALALGRGGLTDRWTVIDPADVDAAPEALRPFVRDEPIDLDGDGFVDLGETTRFHTPMLRLWSKTSTGAQLDVDVTIYGQNNTQVPLEGLLILELQKLGGASQGTLVSTSSITVASGNDVRIGELETNTAGTARALRIALVDQPIFQTEHETFRRQVVRVVLSAPALADALRRDHDLLLRGLFLARRGAEPDPRQKW